MLPRPAFTPHVPLALANAELGAGFLPDTEQVGEQVIEIGGVEPGMPEQVIEPGSEQFGVMPPVHCVAAYAAQEVNSQAPMEATNEQFRNITHPLFCRRGPQWSRL
jgi:hypothetical protein